MSYVNPSADNCSPNPYRPARDMAPDGTENTSRTESGGQLYNPADIDDTPSMEADRGAHGNGGMWSGPTGTEPGNPPAD